jgi:hypothetical protein
MSNAIYANLDPLDLQDEEWMDVYGWDGLYQASSLGRIKSLSREVVCGNHTRRTKERILRQTKDVYGCLRVSFSQNSVVTTVLVGKVVFEAFNRGPVVDGNLVMHKNKTMDDNRIKNLSEASVSESNKLNYHLGVAAYRGIGAMASEEADKLDEALITSPSARVCRTCKRELPNSVFNSGRARPHRNCLDCRLIKKGVVSVGKQRLADELFARGLRRCNPCGQVLPLDGFGISRTEYGGRNHTCILCRRASYIARRR